MGRSRGDQRVLHQKKALVEQFDHLAVGAGSPIVQSPVTCRGQRVGDPPAYGGDSRVLGRALAMKTFSSSLNRRKMARKVHLQMRCLLPTPNA